MMSAISSPGQRKKDRIDALAESGSVTDDDGVSLWQSAWRRLRRDPVFLVGASIILIFVVIAVIAPFIAPHDPTQAIPELREQITPSTPIPPPQPGFPLGGDNAGRDLFSRLLVGAQQTLIVGVVATLGGLLGGLVLGTLAGGIGGWIPIFARLLRGSMLSQRHSDHVLAARALGVRHPAVVFRHMLPNSLGPVIVQGTLVLAVAIIDAAALSFLGLGNADDSVPEWGQMLGKAQTFFNTYPHIAVYPALCIIVVALGFTLMGESLREALDPKSRR
jgi:peptide/nickel transport system permease protein